MKHTQGTWEMKAETGKLGVVIVTVYTRRLGLTPKMDKKEVICDLPVRDREEAIANANLIAAAPELLIALKNIANSYYAQSNPDFQDEVYALIARAEGKGRLTEEKAIIEEEARIFPDPE